MAWLDAVTLNLMPILIIISILAIFVVRRPGLWRGLGAAWLATFATALAIAALYPNSWSMDCGLLGLIRTGVGHVTVVNPSPNPCGIANDLPLWLVALPPTMGIVILLAWVWRRAGPSPVAMQMIAILVGCAVLAVLLGQLNENLALLFVVVVAAAAYAWPRLQRQPAT